MDNELFYGKALAIMPPATSAESYNHFNPHISGAKHEPELNQGGVQ